MLGRFISSFGLVALLAGCNAGESIADSIDQLTFGWWGGTLFSSPNQVTMKEIHLDNGGLLGRSVIIEGSIVSVGKHYSHIVVADETARIMIVLTNLPDAEQTLKRFSQENIRILGSVERGKKGLPFVLAKSLQSAPASKKP